MKNKYIFVSGANGFTGRFLCLELKKRNIQFKAILRHKAKINWMIENSIDFVFADLQESSDLKKILIECKLLINLASIGFGNAPIIIEACQYAKVERVIFISTTAIFTNLNAKSKSIRIQAENQINNSNLNWTILRPTMIYGSDKDRNISKLIKFIEKFHFFPVFGTGRFFQQPIYVKDLVWCIAEILYNEKTFLKSYNVAGKNPLTFIELINIVAKALKINCFIIKIPVRITLKILDFIERIGIKFFVKAEQIRRLNENKSFSYKDASIDFGFKPKTFEEGIKDLLKRYSK